ncbi:MAG: hypothetical protein LRS43_03365 [Desulfurococcales archaeon]|nr:hypothetical protein [Desulfurococcales archaeon]
MPDGVTLKAGLAGVVDADAIVSVGLSGDALELLRSLVRAKILELPRLVAKTKSREDRVMHRERLIAKNLEGAKTRAFKVSTVKFHGLPVFKGRELPKSELSKLDPRAIYGERQGEMLVLVSKRPQARAADVTYLKPGWERGLIASVMDKSGASALGLIEKIDYSRKLVHVYTGFKGLPDCIIVGRERIDPSPFKGRVSW